MKSFKHLYRTPEFISILSVCGLIIVLPWFQRGDLYKDYMYDKVFLFFMVTGMLLVLNALMLFSLRRKFHLSLPDILIVIFVIYLFLNRHFVSQTEGYSLKYFQSGALVIFYFLLRSYPAIYHKYFLYSIIFSGMVQSIYGMLQLYGIFPSRHNLFNITGSFSNPGPYAGYLSIVLPLALALWLKEREELPNANAENTLPGRTLLKLKSLVPFAALIAILLVLPSTRSRAAWLAALISSAIVLNYFYPFRSVLSPFRKPGLKKFLAISIVLIFVSGALTGIYFMKKGSADGRLFIWKTSCQLIKEKPLFGHGVGKFTAYYMDKQAYYFKNNPGSVQANVADDILYPFNEYIKSVVELGFAGLAILALIVFLLLWPEKKSRSDRIKPDLLIPRAGILAFLVFSFFSYPSEILSTMLNMVVLFAVTTGAKESRAHIKPAGILRISGWRPLAPRIIIGLGSLAIIVIAAAPIKRLNRAYYYWDEGNMIYQVGAYGESIESFEEAYPYLKNNGGFLIMYGKALSLAEKYGKAIEVLQEAGNYQKNTILYNALGDSYKATGEFEKAESAYLKAYCMLPGRFYSKYLLAILYRETGQKDKALSTALELMGKEVKVPSMAIEEIRTEMQKTILSQEDDQ